MEWTILLIHPKAYTQVDRLPIHGSYRGTVWTNGEMHQKIANLDNLVKIIRLFGPACEKYYGFEIGVLMRNAGLISLCSAVRPPTTNIHNDYIDSLPLRVIDRVAGVPWA